MILTKIYDAQNEVALSRTVRGLYAIFEATINTILS